MPLLHQTIIVTAWQQTFNHCQTKRSKINNHESQWQSRITSDQKDRKIIRSDDSNPSYENSSTEKILSLTSAVTSMRYFIFRHVKGFLFLQRIAGWQLPQARIARIFAA